MFVVYICAIPLSCNMVFFSWENNEQRKISLGALVNQFS